MKKTKGYLAGEKRDRRGLRCKGLKEKERWRHCTLFTRRSQQLSFNLRDGGTWPTTKPVAAIHPLPVSPQQQPTLFRGLIWYHRPSLLAPFTVYRLLLLLPTSIFIIIILKHKIYYIIHRLNLRKRIRRRFYEPSWIYSLFNLWFGAFGLNTFI